MGSIPPPTFQGQSKYASDFQQVLSRAVAIASLPLQQMQNQLSTLTAQQSSLSSLQSTFGSLQTAIQNIGSSAGAVTAASSSPQSVSASASSGALPGTYTIQVDSLGSYTQTLSSAGSPAVTDPTVGNISPSANFTLTVNSNHFNITPSGNSLDALASAINAAGAGVSATVVNVGSSSSPDYRLSVSGNLLESDTIQLNDGTNNLLSQLGGGGAPTTYQVNGLPTVLQTTSPQVTLSTGLTVNLLQQTSSPVTITVAQDSSSLSNSLNSFVSAYNSAVDALAAQHGQNAGALAGDSTILTLGQALTSISEYSSGSSGVTSLADLGLTLDSSTGHLSLDPTVLSSANPSAVQAFLGSVSTGGFLQTADNTLTSLTDPTSGVIQDSLTSLQTSITNENNVISRQIDQVTTLQTNLQKQLSQADATLATLEQQVTFMTDLFATMYPGSNSANSTNGPGTIG